MAQCLKFTQKVAFNIASEASYVCILSIKNSLKVPKMVNLGTFWKTEATWKQCYQTGQFQKGKNWWKGPKLKNWQWDILCDFQPLCMCRKLRDEDNFSSFAVVFFVCQEWLRWERICWSWAMNGVSLDSAFISLSFRAPLLLRAWSSLPVVAFLSWVAS